MALEFILMVKPLKSEKLELRAIIMTETGKTTLNLVSANNTTRELVTIMVTGKTENDMVRVY